MSWSTSTCRPTLINVNLGTVTETPCKAYGIIDQYGTLIRIGFRSIGSVLSTRIEGAGLGWSYRRAMECIAAEGNGAVLLIGQNITGQQQLADVLQFPQTSSVTDHSGSTGVQNYRLIGTGSQILKRLGIEKMRLMSAPVHFNALSGFNLEVTEFVQP